MIKLYGDMRFIANIQAVPGFLSSKQTIRGASLTEAKSTAYGDLETKVLLSFLVAVSG